jgi:exopolyphosphatase/guanosine-5'-triphosphate,3'-diphosphate pyrophosphatase
MIEPLPDFTRSEKLVIANIARYHRKAWPSNNHTCYAILSDRERRIVDLLAPLLRLADGLDRSHNSVIKELTCKIQDDSVEICIDVHEGTGADAEIESAAKRSALFRSVYNRELRIERTEGAAQLAAANIEINV